MTAGSTGTAQTDVTTLVSIGLGHKAVHRIISDPPRADLVSEDIEALRRAGFHREAAVIDLVVTSPAAAALTSWELRANRHRTRNSMVQMAVTLASVGLGQIHPLLVLVPPAGFVAALIVRFRRRRLEIGDEGWNLLVDWWLEPVRQSAAHQLLLALGLVAAVGVLIGAVTSGAVLLAMFAAIAAFPLGWIALRGWTGRSQEAAHTTGEVRSSLLARDHGWSPGSSADAVDEVLVERPQTATAIVPIGLLFATAALVLVAGDPPGSVLVALGPLVGAFAVWRRARATYLRLDRDGVTYRGLFRTRRWTWDQVREVRARDDGFDRFRVEVVAVGERGVQLWSGSVDDPRLVTMMRLAQAHADESEERPRSRMGCLLGVLWAVLVVGVLSITGLLQSPAHVPVDPASVPSGVEIRRDADDAGQVSSQPYVTCVPALREPDGWEPPGCADERAGQEVLLAVVAALTVAAATTLVLSRRRTSRARRPMPEGPIS